MAALRQAFLEAATEDRLRKLGERLYAAALAGDWQAAGLFLRFVLGRPGNAVDPDRVDLEEWQLRRDGPDFADVLGAVRKMVAKDALRVLQSIVQAEEPHRLLSADASPQVVTAAGSPAADGPPAAENRGHGERGAVEATSGPPNRPERGRSEA
jgi:hypothetical protein